MRRGTLLRILLCRLTDCLSSICGDGVLEVCASGVAGAAVLPVGHQHGGHGGCHAHDGRHVRCVRTVASEWRVDCLLRMVRRAQ